jgi:hypothetical protein
MNTFDPLSDATGQAPATGRDVLTGFEERLLAELKMAIAEQASAGLSAVPAPLARRERRAARPGAWARPRPTLVAAGAAALAAGAVIVLVLTAGAVSSAPTDSGHPGAVPSKPATGVRTPASARAGHPPAFGPATTAADVLHNAALAALEQPASAPAPEQFVYTKVVYAQPAPGGGTNSLESWLSVDGVQAGLVSGGTPATTGPTPGCRDGWYYYPNDYARHQRCDPSENAAYFPGLPTSPGPLRAFLENLDGASSYASGLLTNVESMITTDYLLPRQEAALYQLLARTPGLTVVPRVANIMGVTGVGIRANTADKGTIYTIIFNPVTYAPLGMDWHTVSGTGTGTSNGEVLQEVAIVDKPGQRP